MLAVVPPPVRRRTALVLGTAGLAALTGCGADPADPADPAAPAASADDPDGALVDEVIARITAAAARAASVPQLAAMHAAHLEALDAEPAASSTTPAPTAGELRRVERSLQRQLVDASMRAESGALARLLASMSAAVSQQLVSLPAARSGGGA